MLRLNLLWISSGNTSSFKMIFGGTCNEIFNNPDLSKDLSVCSPYGITKQPTPVTGIPTIGMFVYIYIHYFIYGCTSITN